VARDILKRYYTKQPITREECEKAGVCSQVEWNQVNKAFQVIGWKRGYKFYPPDEFKLAYAIWGSKTEWFNNALWAKDPRGNLKLVE
jgi:hypothetical protein